MWDEQRTQLLLEMKAAGQAPRTIAQALGMSRSAVIGKLWRLKYKGRPKPKRKPKMWDEQRTHLILDMRAAGQATRTIAQALGMSRNAVIGKLWRLKYKGRPKPKRKPKMWDEQRTHLILDMRAAGQATRTIAQALGMSRNAVIGKLWRLKYKGRPKPKRKPKPPPLTKLSFRRVDRYDAGGTEPTVGPRSPLPLVRRRRKLPGRICFLLGFSR